MRRSRVPKAHTVIATTIKTAIPRAPRKVVPIQCSLARISEALIAYSASSQSVTISLPSRNVRFTAASASTATDNAA